MRLWSLILLLPLFLTSQTVFEEASIKPATSDGQSVISRLPGGRLQTEKTTLKALVQWAYELTNDQIDGGPGWFDSERFDIVAIPGKDSGNEQVSRDRQIRLMLQTLLTERFKLKSHNI